MSPVSQGSIDGRLIVQEVAGMTGGELRRLKLRLPAAPGGFFDIECTFRRGFRVIRVASNGAFLAVRSEQEGPFVVAIGGEDKILAATRPLTAVIGIGVFVPGWLDDAGRDIVKQSLWGLTDQMNQLQLVPGTERLLVAKNEIVAVLEPSAASRVLQRVDAVLAIGESLTQHSPPGKGEILPAPFGELQDLVPIWALDDDEQRARLVAAATDSELIRLQALVYPHIGRINEVLDVAPEPPSGSLTALARLAEVTTEATIELRRREES